MADRPKRNVLLIIADQWRGDCLNALGHPSLKTQALDELASVGTTFAKHFAQATPCGPSRASMYTGLYLMNHRSVNNGTPLDSRHATLAQEARAVGYDPTLFGYTSTSVDPRTVGPDDPRLEDYEGILPGFTPGVAGKWEPWLTYLRGKGFPGPLTPEGTALQRQDYPDSETRGATYAPPLYSAEDSETAFLCDQALQWLSLQENRGWFLHLSIKKPHAPWIAPEPYNAMYDPDATPDLIRAASASAEASQHPYLAWMIENHHRAKYLSLQGRREADASLKEIRQARAVYYGLMTEVDHHIGRIFDYLKTAGQWNETFIVFTSDHGEYLGDHHLMGKNGYFDQAFHVPLIIRDPDPAIDGNRGARVDTFTEGVDLMPTILDWIGRQIPPPCDGKSLLPLLRGGSAPGWRTEAHWEFDFREIREPRAAKALDLKPDECSLAVVRGDRYKYVHFTALPPLFFDLEVDPLELTDLAGNPDYRERELEYARKMLSWRMNHADRTLANMHVGEGGLYEWRGPRR